MLRQNKKSHGKIKSHGKTKKTTAKQKSCGKTKKARQNKKAAAKSKSRGKKTRANTVWSFIHEYFTIFITSIPLCKKNYITVFNYREHEQVII